MAKKKFKNKKQVNFSQGGSGGVTEREMKDDFREEGSNHKFKNKKGKNKKKYEKQNRSKKNNEKFVLKKGILNTLTTLDDDDTDMHGRYDQSYLFSVSFFSTVHFTHFLLQKYVVLRQVLNRNF